MSLKHPKRNFPNRMIRPSHLRHQVTPQLHQNKLIRFLLILYPLLNHNLLHHLIPTILILIPLIPLPLPIRAKNLLQKIMPLLLLKKLLLQKLLMLISNMPLQIKIAHQTVQIQINKPSFIS